MDSKALASAFEAGYKAALTEKDAVDPGIQTDAGTIDPDLFIDRTTQGLKQSVVGGIAAAIISGLIGLGIGTLAGIPIQGAAAGAGLGAALGIPIGSARGQLKADKKHLRSRNISARTPIPIKELLLNPGLSAAIPRTSYTSLRRHS